MQVITEIGEIGVRAQNGQEILLRPSLLAMTRIGAPKEIVRVFASVMSDSPNFLDALTVFYACYEGDEDVSLFAGSLIPDGIGIEYERGACEPAHIVHVARSLLVHGVVGAHKPLPRKAGEDPQFSSEFSARDHVAAAIAHLGVSERDAWAMTMTSIVGALRSKFPETDGPGTTPTIEQHDADMKALDKINELRRKRKGLV